MNMIDIPQGSDEWLLLRAGKVTASRVSDIIAKTKSGYSASRSNYMGQLVAEILTGKPQAGFTNAAMQWGIDTEPTARNAYEVSRGTFVTQTGFVLHPTIKGAGASPDGFVDDGLIEIKCPNQDTHIQYLLAGEPPSKYHPQMAWQCACTRAKWVDFVSFDPRFPEEMQLMIVRYEPEESYIAELENEVRKFIEEVNETVAILSEKFKEAA